MGNDVNKNLAATVGVLTIVVGTGYIIANLSLRTILVVLALAVLVVIILVASARAQN